MLRAIGWYGIEVVLIAFTILLIAVTVLLAVR